MSEQMAESIGARELHSEWVDAVAGAHYTCFDPHELSVRLGLPAIRAFYQLLVDSPYGKCFVAMVGDEVAAALTVFTDYDAFHSRLGRKVLPLLIGRLPRDPGMVLTLWRQRRARSFLSAERRRCHLGAFFRQSDVGPMASLHGFKACWDAGMAHAEASGAPTMWGSTREENQQALDMLYRCGFQVAGSGKGVIIVEKALGTEGEAGASRPGTASREG